MARRVALIALLSLAVPVGAGAATYSSPTPIRMDPFVGAAGPLLPYPSTIDVNGEAGTLTSVRAMLSGIAYSDLDELEVLLTGPSGARALLVNDVCNGTDTTGAPVTFALDDTAAPLPAAAPCPSGTFRPTDISGSTAFLAPAPAGPHPTALAGFNGTTPNGLWQLYVGDDAVGGGGAINGGWSLELTTTGAPPTGQRTAALKKCKKKKSKAKRKKCRKRALKLPV